MVSHGRLPMTALLTAAVVMLAVHAHAQPLAKNVASEDGKFSYSLPENWELREIEQAAYKMAFAPAVAGSRFQSNINIVTEAFGGDLDAYLKLAVPKLQGQFPGSTELDRGYFLTDSKTTGMKLIFDNPIQGLVLRQTFYVFAREGTIYIFTASTLKEDWVTYGPVMERIARSFKFEGESTTTDAPVASTAPIMPPVLSAPNPTPTAEATEATEEVAAADSLVSDDKKVTLALPGDWMTSDFGSPEEGDVYRMGHLKSEKGNEGYSVNLLLSVDAFSGAPAEYITELAKQLPQLKDVEKKTFRTKKGLEGIKLVSSSKNPDGEKITQVMYLFSTPSSKYLVVGTSANEKAEDDIKLFDKIVREGLTLQ